MVKFDMFIKCRLVYMNCIYMIIICSSSVVASFSPSELIVSTSGIGLTSSLVITPMLSTSDSLSIFMERLDLFISGAVLTISQVEVLHIFAF